MPQSPRRCSRIIHACLILGMVGLCPARTNRWAREIHQSRLIHWSVLGYVAMRVVCDAFAAKRFDVVVTLCDRIREVCPDFPSRPDLVHWSIADPALDGQSNRATLPAFERLATDLELRVGFLLRQIEDTRNRRSTNAER